MLTNLDRVGIILSTLLVLIPISSYLRVFYLQFHFIKYQTMVLQILSTRAALFPIFYAIIVYLSFNIPQTFLALQVIIAVCEGYSLLCFLTLIVQNFGSPEACIAQLQAINRTAFCWCFCYSSNMTTYFWTVKNALSYLLTYRLVLVLAASVTGYLKLKVISAVCTIFAFFLIAYGFISLITLCKLLLPFVIHLSF